METNNQSGRRKGGRNLKNDPAIHRYVIYLNNVDNARFLALYDKSCMSVRLCEGFRLFFHKRTLPRP